MILGENSVTVASRTGWSVNLKTVPVPSVTTHPLAVSSPQPQITLGGYVAPGYAFSVMLNVSGLEDGALPGTAYVDFAVPSAAEAAYYNSKNLKTHRLPVLWERLQPTLLGPLDPTYLGYVTGYIDAANALGCGVILDVHNYGSYNGQKVGGGTVTIAHYADLVGKVAQLGLKLAGFDLMNEPNNMPSPSVWPQMAQAGITAWRQYDKVTTLYVEGDGYSSAFQWVANNPTLHLLVDPANNLVYSAHCYLDRNNSGTHFVWSEEVAAGDQLTNPVSVLDTNIGVKRITPFRDWCVGHGFRGHVGELGFGNDDPNWLIAGDNTLAFCKANSIPVTYFAAGPYFVNYPYGVEPSGGEDTVQMAVLTKYTQAAQPNAYFLSGPNRATVGVADTVDVASYHGLVTRPITITPHSAPAGATFSPGSVTIPPGFNGTQSFAVTLPAAATYTIGTTNDSGLTDPAPIGISSRNDPFLGLPTPVNVLSLRRVYTPFIGNAVTLRRDSDDAVRSFGFSGDDFDAASYAAWKGAARTWCVSWQDQGPNGYSAGQVSLDNQQGPNKSPLPPSDADQPEFLLVSGQPRLRFNNSRMDMISPVDGNTAQTILVVMQPSNGNRLLSWDLVQDYDFPNGGNYDLQGEQPVPMNLDPSTLRTYAGRYSCGDYVEAFRDGQLVAQAASTQAEMVFQYRNVANVGYFKFAEVFFEGDACEIVVFNVALTDAQIAAFQASQQAYWGTPNPAVGNTTLTLGTTTATTQALSWTAAANATAYTVQYRPRNATAWLAQTVTGTSTTLTNLFAGQQLDFQVYGTSGGFNGGLSNVVTATLPAQTAGPNAKIPYVGVNLSGPENYPTPIFPPTSKIDYYASKGCNAFRLCLRWESMQQYLGATLDPTYMAQVDTLVSYCATKGAYVVLDVHNYGAYQFRHQATTTSGTVSAGTTTLPVASVANLYAGAQVTCPGVPGTATIASVNAGTNTITLSAATTGLIAAGTAVSFNGNIGVADGNGNIAVTNANFADLWGKIATRYLSNAYVIFGLMNEPGQSSASGWMASVNAAKTAIRGTGATQLILVPGCQGAKNFTRSGFAYQFQTNYTDSNSAVEYHQYFDQNQSGTAGTVQSVQVGVEFFQNTLPWVRSCGTKLWVGEYGAGDGTQAVQCLQNLSALLASNADVVEGVTIWGGGDFTSSMQAGGYPLGLEPYNGADTPQLLTLTTLAPGGSYYGYKPQALSYPLTVAAGSTFVSATSGWGQALLGQAYLDTSTNDGYINVGQIAATYEGRFVLPTAASVANSPVIMAGNSVVTIYVESSGHLAANVGAGVGAMTSTAACHDGNPHHFRFCADGTNSYLFLDGTLVSTKSGSPMSLQTPTGGSNVSLGGYNTSQPWPGTVEYAAVFGNAQSTANFTPPSAPLTSGLPYLVALWQLDGNGAGVA